MPMPMVQGFDFSDTGAIPNISKLKTDPNAKEWNQLQEIILANGDKLFRLTKRGKDHPVQTKSLRVDYQGVARDLSCNQGVSQLDILNAIICSIFYFILIQVSYDSFKNICTNGE